MNNHETRIEDLERHASIANDEMGKVHTRLASIETNIEWIKGGLEKVDTRTWFILTAVIIGVLVNIALKLWTN